MTLMRNKKFILLCFVISILQISCVPLISPYSATAYELTTSLKAQTLVAISEATDPYVSHEAEVNALVLEISKAREFAAGRPKNSVAVEQWRQIMDLDTNLLGGFLQRWKEQQTLNPVFVDEASKNIAQAFDLIIRLEVAKLPKGAQY